MTGYLVNRILIRRQQLLAIEANAVENIVSVEARLTN